MNVKEFLSEYRNIINSINSKLEQIVQLRTLATKASQAFGEGGGGGGPSDKVGRAVAKIVDLEQEVNAEIDELVKTRREIERAISTVADPLQRRILVERYINGRKFSEIAAVLGYSENTIYICHRRGISKISKKL